MQNVFYAIRSLLCDLPTPAEAGFAKAGAWQKIRHGDRATGVVGTELATQDGEHGIYHPQKLVNSRPERPVRQFARC